MGRAQAGRQQRRTAPAHSWPRARCAARSEAARQNMDSCSGWQARSSSFRAGYPGVQAGEESTLPSGVELLRERMQNIDMDVHRAFRYKLAPTAEQEGLFRQFAGVCRLIYNLALEQRRDWWRHYQRQTGCRLNYVAQARDLTVLRAEYDWIAAVSQTCQQQALRDLDKAFANFFAGRGRYPTPRRKGVNDAFRFQGREIETRRLNAKWSAIRLPKIGWVKFRDTRPMEGRLLNVTVSLDALGWHISFAREIEHVAPVNICPSVGIDRGI